MARMRHGHCIIRLVHHCVGVGWCGSLSEGQSLPRNSS